jgi:hypothetical protein
MNGTGSKLLTTHRVTITRHGNRKWGFPDNFLEPRAESSCELCEGLRLRLVGNGDRLKSDSSEQANYGKDDLWHERNSSDDSLQRTNSIRQRQNIVMGLIRNCFTSQLLAFSKRFRIYPVCGVIGHLEKTQQILSVFA